MTRRRIGLVLVMLITVNAARSAPATRADDGPDPPQVAPADQRFVTWVVRRTLEKCVRDGSDYVLSHRPEHLEKLNCQVAVTLRQGGVVRAVGVSKRGPILQASRRAAIEAVKAASAESPITIEILARIRIEIEAIGEVEPTPIVPYWGTAQSYAFLEPGVHGVILQLRGATAALRPSEFISRHTSAATALRHLAERMNPDRLSHQGVMASWFRTTHWHELEPGGEIATLHRGLTVVAPEVITEHFLDRAIRAVADYMIYRQMPDGAFSYQYEPSSASYTDYQSYTRQADAARALSTYATHTGDRAAAEAARRAIEHLVSHVTHLRDTAGAAYLLGPDGGSDLGATALLCLALTEHPAGNDYRDVRDALVASMLWLQRPSGRIISVFPPALVEQGGNVHPGQALTGLSRVHEELPLPAAVRAFEAAVSFYRTEFRKDPDTDFVPWHTHAFARMARLTRRRDYADFVFEMNDWLAGHQLNSANCAWPELRGAIDPPGPERPGAATAAYLDGLLDALTLARDLGDKQRTRRYEQAARAATRFVVQLQFRREEGFYVRSPIDCYGGIRRALWDNRIRIDHCGQALTALTMAREELGAGH